MRMVRETVRGWIAWGGNGDTAQAGPFSVPFNSNIQEVLATEYQIS